jgi:hypothetical protein
MYVTYELKYLYVYYVDNQVRQKFSLVESWIARAL